MRISLLSAGTLLLQACHVQAKAVFAHFMVGNTPTWELSDWKNNIQLAVDAHLDAFALNIANGWYANDASLALAFEAAASLDFQLFFSFDYAGNGSWSQADVISLITKYGSSDSYFQYNGGPFVSTFEGPDNADDWVEIKSQTGCFFIPDWSSLGAIPAAAAADGVVDGLFSWAGWPWGDKNMTTFVDASYMQTLNASGKPYMMPVSPWFYTNMPGYDKNWLWRGDDSWYQRWQQVWYLQPDFVEIISWNDFGESHYIGPLDNSSFDAFTVGQAPFNYAENMPHDGWRDLLPFMIDAYKHERALVTDERLVVWYRTSLANDCSNGNTTGNTASQLQLEFAPEEVSQDRLFFTALLSDYAGVGVMVDADFHTAEWDFLPPGPLVTGGPGLYHGSIALKHLERVEVFITRDDVDVFSVFTGQNVSPDNCVDGLTNWNAFVASGSGGTLPEPVYSTFNLSLQTCVAGYSVDAFTDLCEFTCAWGYCPVGACVCTNMGIILEQANQTGTVGYPANGDANYAGLCRFACAAGYCPSKYCSLEVQAAYVPTSSPFDPPTCTEGNSTNDNFLGLCSYACNFGFCPRNSCSCSSEGPLIQPPAQTSTDTGISLVGPDSDLCNFACTRGYCPSGTCTTSANFDVSVLASLGDSFASGPSAGDEYDDTPCRRFTQAAGPQLSLSDEINGPKPIDFKFIACSGARTKQIYQDSGASSSSSGGNVKPKRSQANQLADLKLNFDMITLSIGGNDADFVSVMDRCVYRFTDVKGCAGCTPSLTHNDCSDDCSNALDEMNIRLEGESLISGLTSSIEAIFKAAPKAHLFMTGYPSFWNQDTDACDQVSFKFGCIDNSVLPLIKERRQRMNDLTKKLNGIIKSVVTATSPVGGGSIYFVDVDPYFEGHRFCEEGISEPSYRNSDIWFYPFEYSTGGTLNISAVISNTTNCTSIWDDEGDAGDYFNCELNNAMAADGITIDLSSMSNNVAGNDSLGVLSSGSASLPAFLARIFHPTVNGMTAYKQAVLDVYHGSS